jgi:hypothetical protein
LTTTDSWRSSARRRLASRIASWVWDYLVILARLAGVFVLIGLPRVLGVWDLSQVWRVPWLADLVLTLLTVLPYLLYLVVSEGARRHAKWGKRKSGLEVVGRDRKAPNPGGSS